MVFLHPESKLPFDTIHFFSPSSTRVVMNRLKKKNCSHSFCKDHFQIMQSSKSWRTWWYQICFSWRVLIWINFVYSDSHGWALNKYDCRIAYTLAIIEWLVTDGTGGLTISLNKRSLWALESSQEDFWTFFEMTCAPSPFDSIEGNNDPNEMCWYMSKMWKSSQTLFFQ